MLAVASGAWLTAVAWAAEPVDAAARDALVAQFADGADPRIQAAAWSGRNVFNVGVHYMGGDESAIAREVCALLAARGLDANVKVRAIDINSMGSDEARWEVVGQASCR